MRITSWRRTGRTAICGASDYACANREEERQEAAVIAVARKLSVLLHRLWIAGETRDPIWQRACELGQVPIEAGREVKTTCQADSG